MTALNFSSCTRRNNEQHRTVAVNKEAPERTNVAGDDHADGEAVVGRQSAPILLVCQHHIARRVARSRVRQTRAV